MFSEQNNSDECNYGEQLPLMHRDVTLTDFQEAGNIPSPILLLMIIVEIIGNGYLPFSAVSVTAHHHQQMQLMIRP